MQIFTNGKLCFYIFMEFCDLPKNVIIVPLENSMLWLWLAVIYRYGHWNYYVLDWFSQIMGPLCFWVWYLSLRLECMLKENCFVVLFNKFTKDDFLSVLCTLSSWMSVDGMWIDVICYERHNLSLRPFKFCFQQLQWCLQLQSCFIECNKKEQSKMFCIQLWRLFWKFEFTSCNSYIKFWWCLTQNKTKKKKQTLGSVQYRLEIIFILYTM